MGVQHAGVIATTSRPRVLQVIASVDDALGGPAVGAVALHRALRDEGVHATLLSAAYGDKDGGPMATNSRNRLEESVPAIKIFPRSRPYRMFASWRLAVAIWQASRSHNFIHMHGQYLLPHVYAFVIARIRRIPYGIQAHGTLEPYTLRRSRWRKRVYSYVFGNRILGGAAYVLFASQVEADRASSVISAKQSLTISLGTTLEEPRSSESLATICTDTPRQKCILFLGRLARKKRPDLLIRAWARVQRSTYGQQALLIIAGPNDDFDAATLSALATDLGVQKSVILCGPLYGGEKSWLYQRCGVFVLPSENENFALTVAEAMASGCYVVATEEVAAMSHVSEAGSGAILSSLTEEDLANALTDAMRLTDVEFIAATKDAVSYANEHLSWTHLAKGLTARILEESS